MMLIMMNMAVDAVMAISATSDMTDSFEVIDITWMKTNTINYKYFLHLFFLLRSFKGLCQGWLDYTDNIANYLSFLARKKKILKVSFQMATILQITKMVLEI